MKILKAVLALIALVIAFNSINREQYAVAGYWALVYVYWAINALKQ